MIWAVPLIVVVAFAALGYALTNDLGREKPNLRGDGRKASWEEVLGRLVRGMDRMRG